MIYLYAFLFGGLICALGQLLMDKFKLLPIYVTCLFVLVGSILGGLGIYQMFVKIFGAGAYLPISSFGASLTDSAIIKAKEVGYIGIISGLFNSTSAGIVVAIVCSFIIALIFKPKG